MSGDDRKLRRLFMGLQTVLGGPARGFFIPYRYAASVRPIAYPAIGALMATAEGSFRDVLATIERYRDELSALDGPAPQPRFTQDWFPRLDGCAAYAIVRQRQPARIVEIGSGHSTRFMARAIADGGLATTLVCIDPQPRAALAGLPVEHRQSLLEDVPPAVFTELGANDILFIDSSHVAVPGSDVDRLFNEVLPRLVPGVVVHVHDVFLPEAYPAGWAWRGYNEQLVVAALLQGGGYAPLFASSYVTTRRPEWLDDTVVAVLPLPAGAVETSLWLEKRR